ncbi:PrsW family glutamic-type intramembrane protease [Alphaproteobacteria bacterium]|nr:PrsW family glutamic-type intramembrane protease [Alphaproteobacteria bacterium]
MVSLAVFGGAVIIWPAIILNELMIKSDSESYLAALTEEPLKFAAFTFLIKNRKVFDEPLDAIVYGTAISLGFAAHENYIYVYQLSGELGMLPVDMAVIRSMLSMPLHACCGAIMGYQLAKYKFSNERWALGRALIFPILLHGIYNFQDTMFGFGFVVFFAVIYVWKLYGEAKKEQQKTIPISC